MNLMDQFANPDTMHSLSLGDKMAGAGITTLMGMGITFVVLILLWLIITVLTKMVAKTESRKKEEAMQEKAPAKPAAQKAPTAPAAASASPVTTDVSAAPAADSGELIAVITAAVAACEGPEVMSNLVIRKIRRVAGSSPAWAREGRQECIDSRRV